MLCLVAFLFLLGPITPARGVAEELLFSSPQDINRLTKRALKGLGREAQEQGNPYNLSSACLHGTEDEEKNVDDEGVGPAYPNPNPNPTSSYAYLEGLPSCLWESGENHVKALAQKEADARLTQLGPSPPSAASRPPGGFAALTSSPGANTTSKEDLEAQLRALPSSTAAGGDVCSMEEQQKEVQAHVRGLRLLEEVRGGAVIKAEALPADLNEWVSKAEKHRSHERGVLGYHNDMLDYGWRLATWQAQDEEEKGEEGRGGGVNSTAMGEMRNWLEGNGGRVSYVEVGEGEERLRAAEVVSEGEVVLSVPLKLTLSSLTLRLVKTKRGLLKEHLDQVFARRPEWGLATFLLHEQTKGPDSRWYPFIRTLRMHVPRNAVLKELQGSFAAELYRRWEEDEPKLLLAYLRRQGPCQHDFYGVCEGWLDENAIRWGLWVVRRYAVAVRKSTTGKDFLALVPMAHLLAHQPSTAATPQAQQQQPPGDCGISLSLDNIIRVAMKTPVQGGEVVGIDRGPWSDAECLLRWHEVVVVGAGTSGGRMGADETELWGSNPFNQIHMALPAVARDGDDLYFGKDRNQEWRALLRYPPKQINLWIATNHLMLYGDSEDEEEQRLVENANKLLAGLPVTVRSEEERLMLLGAARDEEEARQLILVQQQGGGGGGTGGADLRSGGSAVMASGGGDSGPSQPQLYLAVESDSEDDAPDRAMQTLAAAALDLQEAIMASSPEASVQKCVNRTRDFFVHGIRPLRGIDEIDKMLKRKRHLLDKCGPTDKHVITGEGASDQLLCAARVLFVNETDLDMLCPPGEAPFYEMECRCLRRDVISRQCLEAKDHFNASRPISRTNEALILDLLVGSLEGISKGYKTSVEEDEALLALSTIRERTPLVASAVVTRLREKRLIAKALADLKERQERLQRHGDDEFQVETLRAKGEEAKARQAEHQARLQELRARAMAGARVLATVVVDVQGEHGGKWNLTVREGEALDHAVQHFAREHGVGQEGQRTLLAEARKKIPPEPRLLLVVPVIDPLGVRRVLTVREGDNVTTRAIDFCLAYNVSDTEQDEACQSLAKQAETQLTKRLERKVLLTVPVSLVDGRSVFLDLRDGDQHDIVHAVSAFASAYRMGQSYVGGLTQEVERRLPRPIVSLPVNVEGVRQGGLVLRVSSLEGLDNTLKVFCETYGITPIETMVPMLRQRVMGLLHPDAVVMPGKQQQ